ncbi:MAG TPA: PAS domain-containing protein, partial [Bacteroidota bacterium]|nr:PAS domain-containing protein [Bacteroidota bacterium]
MSFDLLEALPYLCFVLGRDGVILHANSPATKLISANPVKLTGKPLLDFITPESAGAVKSALATCVCGGAPAGADITIRGDESAGRILRLSFSLFPGDGAAVGTKTAMLILATGRDVSEEKKRDLDFLRFSNLAHQTVNPLEITDVEGRIIYVNPAFEKSSGYSSAELIGRNPNVFSSGKHPAIFWMKMWETIKNGKVWTGEVENRRRNGDPFHTQLLISPVLDSGGTIVGYFGIHRDITEQKSLEKHLLQAQKMESMGLLTAGIAHEVGNPLTSISSLVQVLERTSDDTFIRDKLELIKNQVNRISRIIRDLVDFSRRSNYEIQLTDVNACLREAIAIVSVAKKAKAIDIENRPAANLPRLALVSDQIQQVLVNVLINAVDAVDEKFGAVGPEERSGRIVCRTAVDGDSLVAEISDNGKGIPDE